MTREEAIVVLEQEQAFLMGKRKSLPIRYGYKDALDMAITALRGQRWIPVTERLPEDGERVLVCTQTRKIKDARYSKRRNLFVTSGQITVTHWKPLPPLPGEGQKEDKI